MNSLSKLSFLIMALGLAACNEKVSPELQGGASTTTGAGGSGSVVIPDVSYFRIVNTADTMLSYKVHKTGTGNANKNCEITGTLPLSSDLYKASPATYDISCFFEAEELALHLNGFEFKIESSPNTCQYIGYAPFSYYDRIPGDSSGTYDRYECEGDVDDAFINTVPRFATASCDTFQSQIAGTDDFSSDGFDEGDLCRFNYTEDDGPNCDIGKITIFQHTLTRLAGPDATMNTADDQLQDTETEREIDCAGKIRSCLDGPLLTEPLLSKATQGIVLQKTTTNQSPSILKSYGPLVGVYGSNRKYANFRRDLAAKEIDYESSTDPLYKTAFNNNTFLNTFDPDLMLNYGFNRRMDGTQLVTTLPLTQLNMFSAIPYAGESYVGVSPNLTTPLVPDDVASLSSNRTNPFYVAYCMDAAFDIKARIKMVVRDWDRVLPLSATSSAFERISDVGQAYPIARQDVPDTDEINGDSDSWNAFNDLLDWDDTMRMERNDSGFAYDPSITIWRPLPTGTYPDGFFNPRAFPNDKLIEQ